MSRPASQTCTVHHALPSRERGERGVGVEASPPKRSGATPCVQQPDLSVKIRGEEASPEEQNLGVLHAGGFDGDYLH